MPDDAYEVGYKRPPPHTRWKKGQSGNPRGREVGQRNLKTELIEEVSERILIREGGEAKTVSKLRALLKAQTAKAVQGDTRAASLLISQLIRLLDPQEAAPEPTPVSEDDRAIIEAFLKRQTREKGGER
jgi:hypothetical protein